MSISEISFGLFGADEIERGSVVEVGETALYDRNLPREKAINDLRMGTVDRRFCCSTCKKNVMECVGHNGHIKLVKPVYHIGYIDVVLKVLRSVCFFCSHLLLPDDDNKLKNIRCASYAKECISQSRNHLTTISNYCKQKKTCHMCGGCQPTYTRLGILIKMEFRDTSPENFDSEEERQYASQPFTPEVAHRILHHISDKHLEMLGFPIDHVRPENMVLRNLVVPPPIMRPTIMVSDGSRIRGQDDLTIKLQDILKQNKLVQQSLDDEGAASERGRAEHLRAYEMLQMQVATYMNHDARGYNQILSTKGMSRSNGPIRSLYFRLRGKKGRVRGNLMGKRCNFSSRTVITPDPYMDIDQIGVPVWIALRQTVPETVNQFNIEQLTKCVRLGAGVLGGAHRIITNGGEVIHLVMRSDRERLRLEFGDVIERYLMDEDWIMFNRQPSLHKQSIMGHRVKVMPGFTFRLPVCDTTPYNADFDGDEMNMHVCQSYMASVEIAQIMQVPRQIISPQSNKPIIGMVQDVLIGAYLFTQKDTFLERGEVMDLLMYVEHRRPSRLPAPAVLHPRPLWTGKQIVSALMPGITLRKKVRNGQESTIEDIREKYVLVVNGQLLAGSMCKGSLGSVSGGVIHIIYKDCSCQAASHFIGDCQRVIHCWLQGEGFSIGIRDCVTQKATEKQVCRIIRKSLRDNHQLQQHKQGEHDLRLEGRTSQLLQSILDRTGRSVLHDIDPQNSIYRAVTSGSKGNPINISQIMACVGQQSVEGRRINVTKDTSLSCYTSHFKDSPQKHGFVANSYFLGLTPQEYFFHAMGGREGLVDTAVKTAATGYISRRLVKMMESIHTEYDKTVRSSSGEIIQFVYGGDGVDPIYIEKQQLPCLTWSHERIQQWCIPPLRTEWPGATRAQVRQLYEDCQREADTLRSVCEIIHRKRQKYTSSVIEDVVFCSIHVRRMLTHFDNRNGKMPMYYRPTGIVTALCDKMSRIGGQMQTCMVQLLLQHYLCSYQVIFVYRLDEQALVECTRSIYSEYIKSLVQPGEMVGAIAASSIGEPCTQMTLNTFHYAGVLSKNVTLGVPRFKELIDVSKNIKTPSITLHLKPPLSGSEALACSFANSIRYTILGDLVRESQLLHEPDLWETAVEADRLMLRMHRMTPTYREENHADQLSSWVIRYTINRDAMEERSITMDILQSALYSTMREHIQVCCSDHNAIECVIRVRLYGLDSTMELSKLAKSDEELVYLEKVSMQQLQNHLLDRVYIHGLKNIKNTHLRKLTSSALEGQEMTTTSQWIVDTEGTNLRQIFNLDGVDFRYTISNDVHEVFTTLGIESGAMVLFNEIKQVLSFDGTYVNDRHMLLLVDTMTFNGFICPVSRHGMARSALGPLMRSSFEETVDVLLDAAGYGENDTLLGVTESIMLGNRAPLGTGFFECDESDIMCRPIEIAPHTDSASRFPGSKKHQSVLEDDDCAPKFVGRRIPTLVTESVAPNPAPPPAPAPSAAPVASSRVAPSRPGESLRVSGKRKHPGAAAPRPPCAFARPEPLRTNTVLSADSIRSECVSYYHPQQTRRRHSRDRSPYQPSSPVLYSLSSSRPASQYTPSSPQVVPR